jgi:hypothetical protein
MVRFIFWLSSLALSMLQYTLTIPATARSESLECDLHQPLPGCLLRGEMHFENALQVIEVNWLEQ